MSSPAHVGVDLARGRSPNLILCRRQLKVPILSAKRRQISDHDILS